MGGVICPFSLPLPSETTFSFKSFHSVKGVASLLGTTPFLHPTRFTHVTTNHIALAKFDITFCITFKLTNEKIPHTCM